MNSPSLDYDSRRQSGYYRQIAAIYFVHSGKLKRAETTSEIAMEGDVEQNKMSRGMRFPTI